MFCGAKRDFIKGERLVCFQTSRSGLIFVSDFKSVAGGLVITCGTAGRSDFDGLGVAHGLAAVINAVVNTALDFIGAGGRGLFRVLHNLI